MTHRIGDALRARIAVAWPTILARVAAGHLIKDVFKDAGLERQDVDVWRLEAPERRAQWQAAREMSADAFMDRAMEEALADVHKEFAQHVRTRIDTLKWAARIRNPQAYGEKAQLDVNVRTVDLTRIIEAANARLLERNAPRIIEAPNNSGEERDLARALPAVLPQLADLL